MTHSQSQLEVRLSRLEQANRRLKRASAGLALLVAAVGLMSFTLPSLCKTVWAERFVLQDSQNRDRMVIDAYSQAHPAITVMDEQGRTIAKLALDVDGGALSTWDENGNAVSSTRLWEPARKKKQGPSESDVLF